MSLLLPVVVRGPESGPPGGPAPGSGRTGKAPLMRKPSIRGTFTALAMLALCGAGPVAVAAAAGPVSAGTVHAGPARTQLAACTSTTKGVTVVVDFAKLKATHKVKVACDPADPKNGLAALTGAGFTYSFVPKYPGFVCRIDGLPKPCNGAPASAYWSYWHAKRGGKWILSKLGAASYVPKPGSVQGWAFGAGKPPRISPP
jgi:hypothetical protein